MAYPLWRSNPYRGSCAWSSSIMRSRVTFATIEAAAIAVHRASPCMTARCAIIRSGTRNASTSTKLGGGNPPRDRIADDLLVEARPLERGDGLGIADARDIPVRIERDGRGHDGARKTAPADLVDAGDQVEPQPPYRVLERPESADLDHRQGGRAIRRSASWPRPSSARPCPSARAGSTASRDGPARSARRQSCR